VNYSRGANTAGVSILLPVYNAAATITAAVDSCLQQTFHDFELLLIDDGSTDETALLLDKFAHSDPRVRIIRLPRTGIAGALNAGLENASGKYIARMDADDVMLPQRLEKQANFLDENPATALVSCLVDHGGDASSQEGYATYVRWINSLVTAEEISLNRFVESPLAHPSVMFRKSLAENFSGYRAGHFPEDYELWLRWMEAGVRMEKVPEVLLRWNDPPERLSRTDPRCSPEAFNKIKSEYLPRFLHERVNGRKLWLCGAGRITRQKSAFLLSQKLAVGGYVDVDPKKIGKQFDGLPVISLDQLPSREAAYVISYVGNRGAREDIRSILRAKGFAEGADFVLAG
jgi:glycosyltransferase involved in cell wall biosynthesis